MSNTPQIRFAGFTDAWEQEKRCVCMAKSMNGDSGDSDSFAMPFQHIVESRVVNLLFL